ncbi:MAG: hypothetical protein ACREEV_00570 [Dongiaceae bacterium]
MVPTSITVAAFVLMFLPVFGLEMLRKRRRVTALRVLAAIGLASAAYCVAAGIALLAGWPHLPAADATQRAVQYWPYGLILVGSFWIIVYAVTQWSDQRPWFRRPE